MFLIIRNKRTIDLVRRLAALTGETTAEAVRVAVQERLKRQEAGRGGRPLRDRLQEIADHCASLPVLRDRTEDEILGYDDRAPPGQR